MTRLSSAAIKPGMTFDEIENVRFGLFLSPAEHDSVSARSSPITIEGTASVANGAKSSSVFDDIVNFSLWS
jgi:hypothetical protein